MISLMSVAMMLSGKGCTPTEPNALDSLGIVSVTVKDLNVSAWLADEHDERTKGLMFVTAEEMAPISEELDRGMLFVFDTDQRSGFWMRNTIINLDIAFIAEDGKIVQTFTMAALDDSRTYTPRSAYRYALEVNAGVFEQHGIVDGDQVNIPESVLKRTK